MESRQQMNEWWANYISKRLQERGWVVIHNINSVEELENTFDVEMIDAITSIYLNGEPKELHEYVEALETEICVVVRPRRNG